MWWGVGTPPPPHSMTFFCFGGYFFDIITVTAYLMFTVFYVVFLLFGLILLLKWYLARYKLSCVFFFKYFHLWEKELLLCTCSCEWNISYGSIDSPYVLRQVHKHISPQQIQGSKQENRIMQASLSNRIIKLHVQEMQ